MTSTHSVVFFGTSDFAIPSLEALMKDPAFNVQLVITQPDKPVGRKKILTPPPVKIVAEKYGITVLQPERVSLLPTSYFLLPTSYFVVVAYGQILSEELLRIPHIAAINLHASLLPKLRGASPMQHALLEGDKETGVTVQQMVRELDAGPILGQKKISIHPRMTFIELHDYLKRLGADCLIDVLKNPLQSIPQDPQAVTMCKKLSRSDGIVDVQRFSAEEIDRRVRALNPWPGVTCMVNGVDLKIVATSLEESPGAYPIDCAHGSTVYVLTVQEPGKKIMSGAAWARGRRTK